MTASSRKPEGTDATAAATLGSLLYADQSKPVVLEAEWIALVRAVAARDRLALHALYDRAHRPVFTLIMRITNDRQLAEELTLDVFHDVWRRAPDYDAGGGTVLGWIMNQARSRAIDRLRFEQRKKRVNPQSDAALVTDAPIAAEQVLEQKERERILSQALSTLTPDERAAIESAFFSELTYAEVATRLNQPLGTVKSRIRSGLEKLRAALAVREEDP